MPQSFKFRLAISLVLILLFSGAKTSYALPKEKGKYKAEISAQSKGEHHLQDEHHTPIALLFQTIADGTSRVWQSFASGSGTSCRFTGGSNIRFPDTSDVDCNFIRWHVVHHLIQQSEIHGRYAKHGFW